MNKISEGLETYKGNLNDIKGNKFLVSISGLKKLEEEASATGVTFSKQMLQETAAYLIILENSTNE